MLDIHALGRVAQTPPAQAVKRNAGSSAGFGQLLTAARQDETRAERCRRALSEGETGTEDPSARAVLREVYDVLLRDTEADYGHLPHDDLTRILAMYARAQESMTEDKKRGETTWMYSI